MSRGLALLGLLSLLLACTPSGQALRPLEGGPDGEEGLTDAELDAEQVDAPDADPDEAVDADPDEVVDADPDEVVDADPDDECDGAGCLCDHSTCSGCCEGGECLSGDLGAACGIGGGPCRECPVEELCFFGICLICSAENCPDGCCLGPVCQPPSMFACGAQGDLCTTCDPTRSDECSPDGDCTCAGGPACSSGEVCFLTGCL